MVPLPWNLYPLGSQSAKDSFSYTYFNFGRNMISKFSHQFNIRPLNVKKCEENLLLFNSIMKRYSVNYWLSEGTALGVVRDGSIIPWDDDVDVAMHESQRDSFIKAIPELEKNGFIICGVYHKGNFFMLMRDSEKIDVDIVTKNGECMAAMTKSAGYTNQCNDILPYLKGIRSVDFLGTTFNVPGDDYLEFLYSSSWRTPQKKILFK